MICKGKGVRTGFGCEQETIFLKNGICQICTYEWVTKTDLGNEWFKKNIIKTNKKLKSDKNKASKNQKIILMSKSTFWTKKVQPIFNEIARLIDYEQPCVATGNSFGQMHGGHYHSVGSNKTISLNLHNIHIQSAHSNKWQSGDDKRYKTGIISIYGQSYLDFIENLTKTPQLNLTKDDLIDILEKSRNIRNRLRKQKIKRNSLDRIKLRDLLNKEVGIYDLQYSCYLE